MKVPFLDLKAQYDSIRDEIHGAMQEVMEQTAFAGGPFVARFEEEFARYCGTRYAVGVSNGTDALWTALLALGIGPGDEVITTPSTFIATAEAISLAGARPRFVDIDERTCNMAPERLSAAITPSTRAIIPVHLFGQMADMDPIVEIARANGLHVVEDACQAHGAEYKGRRAGSIGEAGCFSFYPGKNLGAYGEAGAVVTNDPEIVDKIRVFRDHGQRKKYYHGIIGWNARMDGLQGAILSVKLKHLDKWNELRRTHAGMYRRLLADLDAVTLPVEADYAKHVYHVYATRVQDRDDLIAFLAKRDIHCGIHYPVPLHLQDAYQLLGYREGAFPVAERCAAEFLSLPMFAELTPEQIEAVCEGIRSFLAVTV